MTTHKPPLCPWCRSPVKQLGAKTLRDGSPSIEWHCGSSKMGREPWQSQACEYRVAMQEHDQLEAQVHDLMVDVENMRRQLVKQRKQISELKAELAEARK